jgi:hypothetical protein
MFEYFYHEIIRKTVIAFGTLFNGMEIRRLNSSGEVTSEITVPIAYGPTQKFLARLEQSADLNRPFTITLPRMSFEVVGINYDPRRKTTVTQQFVGQSKTDKTQFKKAYMPVPYDLDFELSIMTKHNDDMLQIIEQILPYFQPSFNLSIDMVESIGEKRDVPMILNSISMSDDYEGDFSTRRALIYTLRFTAKTYLFGPVAADVSKEIIKKVSIGYVAGEATKRPSRDVQYIVEPKATKDYDNIISTKISEDFKIDDSVLSVDDASSISENSYITINTETLYVKSKDGNNLTVERGKYGTPISVHVLGSAVKEISSADNLLIEVGDNFGFDDSYI